MDYKDMGTRVKKLRRAQHMTQEQLAETAQISASFLGHIERGTRIASIETLASLCKALHTSPAYLLEAELESEALLYPDDLTDEQKHKVQELLRIAAHIVNGEDASKISS